MSYTSLAEGFLNAVELLKAYLKLLRDLREVADRKLQDFKSRGFKDMLEMLKRELTDEYFEEVSNSLREINNVDNILVSARLGSHLQSVDYTLRRKERGFGCAGVQPHPLLPMWREIPRKLTIFSIAVNGPSARLQTS